jgi:D-alanyl-D-alanine carboxypeptidase/D-alanyl-D-alanine-endopeptidase (penicillin-binding protein 4)
MPLISLNAGLSRHTKSGLFRLAIATTLSVATMAFAGPNELTDDVRALIGKHKLGQARVGVSLFDLEDGVQLASVRGAEPFTPASNMKVLTSGAALMTLGADFTFKTQLLLDGDRLVLRGDGDPALADAEVLQAMKPKITVDDVIDTLASSVSKAGVTGVRELLVDDRVFDRQFTHPNWPQEQLHLSYCAQVSGLNFHANVLSFFPRPNQSGVGLPAAFSTEPAAPWLPVTVKAKTVKAGKNSAWITRDSEANSFTLRGEVRTSMQAPVDVTLNDSATFFGQVLADAVLKKGVSIAGQPRNEGGLPQGVRLATTTDTVSPNARVLAVVATPISEVLKRCNTDSANLYAESLLKRMGNAVTKEPGSWANGASVLRMTISEKLGPEAAASTTVSDGSGLSRLNQVSPTTMTRWLSLIARDKRICDVFTESLAEPGSGTLRKRFDGDKITNKIYAKSGYIKGVRSLSGYVVNPKTGRRVVFSVLVNDLPSASTIEHTEARKLQEEIVQLADRWLTKTEKRTAEKLGG